ncbi:MAG: nitroreductase family deazaflavin-dependent oxidoreductase [Dermatophilaceae bacterium]
MSEQGVIREIRAALQHSQIIDLTTMGRRTGQPRRVEIFLHSDDGRLFVTGMPRADRTRDWIYNIRANPRIVIHLKQCVAADVPAVARVVTDADERRRLIESAANRWRRTDVEDMMRHSPLIVVTPDVPRTKRGRVS